MTYGQLLALLSEAKLSPEQAAKRLGVSNMTVRRWSDKRASRKLPVLYQRAFESVWHQLVAEGRIHSDSANFDAITSENSRISFQTTLRNLGFSQDILTSDKKPHQLTLMKGLSQIGSDVSRQAEVDNHTSKITAFKRFGKQWKERVFGLLNVIRSEQLSLIDKLVAYGALFYLLAPFDLIPDTIPVIGYLDDYVILGLALAFYARKFPAILKNK